MAITINYPNLPVPTAGQLSPYHQALQTGLENFSAITKASYQPLQLLADIGSKAAYATYSPYSYLGKALSDPATLAILSRPENKPQLDAIMQKLATMPTSPFAGLYGNQSPNGQSPFQQWWQQKSGGQQQNPSYNTQPSAPAENDNGGMSITPSGKNEVATPEAAAEIANQPGTGEIGTATESNVPPPSSPPAATPATGDDLFKSYVAQKFPLSKEGVAAKAAQTATEEDVKLNADLWKDKLKTFGGQVTNNQLVSDSFDLLKNTYKKLGKMEKGYPFGYGPAVSNNAQIFDNTAQNIVNQAARAQQQGHITNMDFQIFERSKAQRSMNEDAFNEIANKSQAIALRDKQAQRFYSEAKHKGYTVDEADTIWSKFIETHPIFNTQTGNLIPENYKRSPFDIASSKSNRSENYIPPKNEADTQGKMAPEGTVWMISPNNYRKPVHKDNIQYALSKGWKST